MSGAPDVDVTKLSDQQLLALVQGSAAPAPTAASPSPQQPGPFGETRAPDADTGRGIQVYVGGDQGGAPGSGEGFGPATSYPNPNAQAQPPAAAPQAPPPQVSPQASPGLQASRFMGNSVNAAASGIPIAGAYLDEADAATAAALAPLLEPVARHLPQPIRDAMGYDQRQEIGGLPSFGQRYDAARNIQRFQADQFHTQHPKLDTGLKLGGGVAGGIAALPMLGAATGAAGPEAGLLARALAGSAEGAGVGAVDAYGRGTGGLTSASRVHGAETGGALGAGLGLALPVVGQVARTAYGGSVGKVVDALRGQRVVQSPVEDEAARMATALRDEAAPPPQRLDSEAALISAKRDPLKVGARNVDEAYMRIARAMERQEMTPQEVASSMREIGPLGVIADTGESTRDLLRAAMNRPGKGSAIASANLRPRQEGIFDPESASFLARPSSGRVLDQAKEGLGLAGKDFHAEDAAQFAQRQAASGPAYRKAYQAAPVARSELSDFAGAPDFGRAYGKARAISQKEFVTQADGTEKIVPLPPKMPAQLDWRTLDLMKQGLDDTISEAKREGIGANAQGASKGYLRRFVAKLDSLNPDYRAAREAFSGPSAMMDALEEGRTLLSEDAPTVAMDLASRPDSERQMLRLGAYQGLASKLGNQNVTFDAASQAGLLKPAQLARFKALFPDAKAFSDFYKTLQSEKAMFATNQAAFGNSSTAKQLLNVAEPSDPKLEGMGRILESAPEGNVMGLIKGIHQFGQESPMSEDTAATIASILSRHHHGDELPPMIQAISRAKRAAAISDAIRKSNGTLAGEGAARSSQRDQ